VVWVESAAVDAAESADLESVYIRSTAALRVLRYLGGVWGLIGAVGAGVPAVVRDWVYDLVARHRHELIAGDQAEACILPSAEQRARFIEWEPAGGSPSAR
jgi:predicted DCC family thiol-disulfide oxidoreductase YuxK